MDSETFYRKYRPQNLSQLDLNSIRQGLTDLVSSGRTPHALLFAGPKGIGKTSAARVLAKALNCQQKKNHEPCNRCEICQSITKGTALDLIEIDAASNRGIDDIRNLKEKISLAPTRCQYKVYIIDEAHMLTKEAFNALLKTLEEPPQHAVFILCTTEPEKLPATIISRCLRFNFQKAAMEEITGSLEKVVKGEKLKVAQGVLEAVARAADGSFRDGQKLLEQLSLAGGKITLAAAEQLLQQTATLQPQSLLSLLTQGQTQQALGEVDRVVAAGGDLIYFTQQLLDRLRLALLAKIGVQEIESPQELTEVGVTAIKQLIGLFSQAYKEIKFSPIPQLPLEMAIVEYVGARVSSPSESGSDQNGGGTVEVKSVGTRHEAPAKRALPAMPLHGGGAAGAAHRNGEFARLESKWADILEQVKPLNHSVQALLRACRLLDFDGKDLKLEVFYKFHKERLETEKCRQIVEQVTGQILETPVRLVCVLGQKEVAQGGQVGAHHDAPDEVPSASGADDILATAENIFK